MIMNKEAALRSVIQEAFKRTQPELYMWLVNTTIKDRIRSRFKRPNDECDGESSVDDDNNGTGDNYNDENLGAWQGI